MNTIFEYKTRLLANNLLPGRHKSRQRGVGADFYRKNHFMADPEPARLDINASFTDLFEQLYVRSYRQPSKLDVLLLIDGSSSMLFGNKQALLLSMYQSIKASVLQNSDPFSCYLFSSRLQLISDEHQLQMMLNDNQPENNKAEALAEIEKIMPRRPSLVFMVSDFYWSSQHLESVLTLLSEHTVVPVVVQNKVEYEDFPLWRFVEVRDLETGKSQLVFTTQHQKDRIKKSYQRFCNGLSRQCKAFSSPPFWVLDEYSAQKMNLYFAARH